MIVFPQIDPVLVEIGPLAIRWYGMMYTLSFLIGWPLLKRRAAKVMPDLSVDHLGDIMVYTLLGLVLGGRVGYVLFYNFDYFLSHPTAIFHIWEGGMSFHGGLIGGVVACLLYARKSQIPCLMLADLVFPIVPLGLFFGRIGNFINGELWGRTTDLPWGMVFPGAGELPRHPSQLYEAMLEGVILFIVLNGLARRSRTSGFLLGSFMVGYGVSRFLVEFVRQPDAHLGLLTLGLSMGQWLTLPLFLLGGWLMFRPGAGPGLPGQGKGCERSL
ncbi:prolipoprotein diacylglyceryl transferase [Magnetococcus marinus MC-1]|uniref:Phosphatidylglycerol--prolipoprotein diacylglyceryl transferase n=1 Tax=Magnetococcus marinus (strain ATCC BAA-1437 / JCM 17883 / MC-1) TaxID=156889 RepID=A0L8U5_MAGMM|nr:prolipoprotein diacylglyceryl transferase [Magnetococcus marinus]ABK44388.1 prolipoprotein diacylglyceryl transferase [Magnetococcus marinus MC-1]